MRATVLGSGTCVVRVRRASSCVWVRVGGSQILLDTGMGALRRLAEAGGDPGEITHLFYSHLHPDHTAEFAPFLFAGKYPAGLARKKPFTVAGARGFSDFYKGLQTAWGHWIVPDEGMMTLQEVDADTPDRLDFPDFSVETFPMAHTPQSIGFRITAGGGILAYSGDTDVCGNLVSLARDADLFFCECSTPDGQKVEGHLTPSLAGAAAAEAGAKHLVLYHLYPECDETDIAAQAASAFKGKITVAEDLMEFSV
ncbi:MAG: ribonuclease Z [Proteobacteria bacterium]|nr:ribonuclease Z [Pseudomonadota bacterium]